MTQTDIGTCKQHVKYRSTLNMTPKTMREGFYQTFSMKQGELDGHTYLGFKPNVLPEEVWNWHISQLQSEREKAFLDGYKKGVADEIECVETSGEHLDLQHRIRQKYLPVKENK